MRWMVWPRQYGKTYQVTRWFAEDPRNRVILTENAALAAQRRRELEDSIPDGFTPQAWRKHLRMHVLSFRSWLSQHDSRRKPFPGEIAVDGLEYILPYLLRGNVTVAAGAGVNDTPDPVAAQRARAFHEEMARLLGMTAEEFTRQG